MSNSLGIINMQKRSLVSSFAGVFLSARISFLLKRSCELNGLLTVHIVCLNTMS